MAVATYSPEDVVITFSGYILEDWDSVSISKASESFRQVRGIRGKNTRIRVNDTSSEVNIEVALTSELNYVFSEILRQDQITGNGRLEITIKNVNGGEVFSTTDAYICKDADQNYQKDISTRSWKIYCMTSKRENLAQVWSLSNLF